jgi:hypothetical protein
MARPDYGNLPLCQHVTNVNTSIYVFTVVLGPHCLQAYIDTEAYIRDAPLSAFSKEVTG